jgi:hypothetical protein
MKLIHRFSIIALAACNFLTSCERDEFTNIKVDQALISELKSKAVDVVTIDAQVYFLDAYLWRDFMPISPPNGKPLISINWLIRTDSTSIPIDIVLKQQFVIKGDSVWIADYTNESHQTLDYKQERVSRNGPKWGPKIYVDVIAKITDTKTSCDYYLRRDKVFISRTD